MGTLVKLRLTQLKGTLRSQFAKPLSAIVTLLIVGVYLFMLVPLFLHAGEPPVSGAAAYNMVLYIAGFALMLDAVVFIQNRKSLFFTSDAFYLYTGPFTRRKVLGTYAIDMLSSGLLYGLLSLLPVVMGASSGSVPLGFILVAFFACTCAHYCVRTLNGILYLRELVADKKSSGQYWLLGGFAALVVGIGAAVLVQTGFDPQQSATALAQGPLLNWIPFFGWARMAMLGVLQQDLPLSLAGLGLLAAGAAAVTFILVNVKGDFTERSMADAESFTEYYQKARSGQSTGDDKVHRASLRFSKGAGAILSKNLLIALKGRELLRLQDFIVIAVYLGMAYFMGMGFVTFAAMLMVWMFMMASTSSLVDDLQHHYVYLIPGGALKKLLCTLAIPLAKNAIVLLLSLAIGGLLMGASVFSLLTGGAICLTLLFVFMAGNVLSLRLLKSRTNKMVEQTLRMVLTVITLLPGFAVFMLVQVLTDWQGMALAAPIFAGFNLLFSLVVLLACSPMMQGNELNAD